MAWLEVGVTTVPQVHRYSSHGSCLRVDVSYTPKLYGRNPPLSPLFHKRNTKSVLPNLDGLLSNNLLSIPMSIYSFRFRRLLQTRERDGYLLDLPNHSKYQAVAVSRQIYETRYMEVQHTTPETLEWDHS